VGDFGFRLERERREKKKSRKKRRRRISSPTMVSDVWWQ